MGTQQAPMNDSRCYSQIIITGARYEKVRKHSGCFVIYVVPWKILISGSLISARLYSIKLIIYRQSTWKMSFVPGEKRANLTKGASWAPEWINAYKNCGKKAKLSIQEQSLLNTFSRVKTGQERLVEGEELRCDSHRRE